MSMRFVPKKPTLLHQLRSLLPFRSAPAVLHLPLHGALPDTIPSFTLFAPHTPTLPGVCASLRAAAHDPDVSSALLTIPAARGGIGAAGYAKIQELVRHIKYFRASGKKIRVWMESAAEKEFLVATAADEWYVPPAGHVVVAGVRGGGVFLKGLLSKVGAHAEVERVGEYKTSADALTRETMGEQQREVIESVLDGALDWYKRTLAENLGITEEEVARTMESPPARVQELLEKGWLTGIKYLSEVQHMLKMEQKPKLASATPQKVAKYDLKTLSGHRYAARRARGLGLRRGPKIAVVRMTGMISPGESRGGGVMGADTAIRTLRKLAKDDKVKGILLRIDSPGGSALASDNVWQVVKEVNAIKPVVASMGDVAASGGYYIAMAARAIVAEEPTITGSIGVVAAKLSLGELYAKLGVNVERFTRGGELAGLADSHRVMTAAERKWFAEVVADMYGRFTQNAKDSRNAALRSSNAGGDFFSDEDFEAHARGRVWLGKQAAERKIVDALGGVWKGIELLKRELSLPADADVDVVDVPLRPPGFWQRFSPPGLDAATQVFPSTNRTEVLALSEIDGQMSEMHPIDQYFLQTAVTGPIRAILQILQLS